VLHVLECAFDRPASAPTWRVSPKKMNMFIETKRFTHHACNETAGGAAAVDVHTCNARPPPLSVSPLPRAPPRVASPSPLTTDSTIIRSDACLVLSQLVSAASLEWVEGEEEEEELY